MDNIFGTQVTGYCEQICCIKKQTWNSCLNSYNSKKLIKINYRSYYKVVTKLLKRANIDTATREIAELRNKKKAVVWKNI
jgi:hypothetical protein